MTLALHLPLTDTQNIEKHRERNRDSLWSYVPRVNAPAVIFAAALFMSWFHKSLYVQRAAVMSFGTMLVLTISILNKSLLHTLISCCPEKRNRRWRNPKHKMCFGGADGEIQKSRHILGEWDRKAGQAGVDARSRQWKHHHVWTFKCFKLMKKKSFCWWRWVSDIHLVFTCIWKYT